VILHENKVIESVAAFLIENGYSIHSMCSTTQRGFDIDAVRGEARLIVEAKGEGAANPTKRERFTANQCRQSVEAGLFKLASHCESGASLGLALPAIEEYEAVIRKIRAALKKLGIAVYWVGRDGSVREHLQAS